MKFMLNHLTGSLQGRTQYFDTDLLRIGTGEQCGLLFDGQKDAMVSPLHAEIVLEDHRPIVRDRSGRDALLVNGRGTAEGLLSSGDLIQLGEGGPEIRFRLLPDGTPEVKPWRNIVADSRDIVVRMPHARYMSPLYLTGHLVADVIRYGSLSAKSMASRWCRGSPERCLLIVDTYHRRSGGYRVQRWMAVCVERSLSCSTNHSRGV